MVVFSKLATFTDITSRLELPITALDHILLPLGEHKVELAVTDSSGEPWIFCCCTRPQGHRKPCLRTGWLAFVRAKRLRVGDRISLHRLEVGAFRIEVRRRVDFMLFGNQIEVEVA
ncbi:hypothetical protein Pint_18158 [Pistacia integerrima]|uniref:Uncharacterized protein n=1 Tax=Pistacia integerrima TaxID=434235 RepID=A0ACC0YZD2_9ROSI|nr:hypothetical protein Pint_18158 [Pistacia integerrima]